MPIRLKVEAAHSYYERAKRATDEANALHKKIENHAKKFAQQAGVTTEHENYHDYVRQWVQHHPHHGQLVEKQKLAAQHRVAYKRYERQKGNKPKEFKVLGAKKSDKNWSEPVTNGPARTYPPDGTLTKPAAEIAKIMRSKKVSPKGLGSAIRYLQFALNRSGPNGSLKGHAAEIRKAMQILHNENESKKKGNTK